MESLFVTFIGGVIGGLIYQFSNIFDEKRKNK